MDIETRGYTDAKPHSLKELPPKISLVDDGIIKELLLARTEIAELKGYSLDYPNPLLLLSPAIIKESLASSEIENIHTTLIDVLQNSLLPEAERHPADKEVLRYREAVMKGFKELKHKPIVGSSLALDIHGTLMQMSGHGFRKDQNAIVNKEGKIIFVPPKSGDIPRLMKNWEQYVNAHSEDLRSDPLIKSAVAHYQFESIHPFDDGNGRTGRILMVLQLINDGLLTAPILYISGYINKNRNEYYQLLRNVTDKNEWVEFVLFMIKGFKLQARMTKNHLLETKGLFENTKKTVREKIPSIYSHELIEALFTSPIITPTYLAKKIRVHHITASSYLRKLEELKILRLHRYGRYAMYGNVELIKLLNK